MEKYPLIIDGERVITDTVKKVTSPWTGEVVAECCQAGASEVSQALDSAVKGFERMRRLRNYQRSEFLHKAADLLSARRDDFARMIALEGGKPILEARNEATRAETTFRIAAEEARSWGGVLLPLDIAAAGGDRIALVRRFPRGVVTGISPFNFPLNLVAHKIAPALAVGCSINLKPASSTPVSAVMLGELLLEAGVPNGGCNILPLPSGFAGPLVEDARVKVLTFTGSGEVGWNLKRRAWDKQVCLELGGNAAAIVDADCDLDYALERILVGGYAHSGQICISVQHILVQGKIIEDFRERFVPRVESLKMGDPLDEETRVAALIEESEAVRVEAWIDEAIEAGAELLCGGKREANRITPAVLENVPEDCRLAKDEVFGPVTVLSSFETLEEAVARVNSWQYGLQCGVFTRDIEKALMAYNRLDVGGVIINDIPTIRVDNYPYGGMKKSGFGREGVKYAMEEMYEFKTMVIPSPR